MKITRIDRGEPYEPPALLDLGRLEGTFVSIEDQPEFFEDDLIVEEPAECQGEASAGAPLAAWSKPDNSAEWNKKTDRKSVTQIRRR